MSDPTVAANIRLTGENRELRRQVGELQAAQRARLEAGEVERRQYVRGLQQANAKQEPAQATLRRLRGLAESWKAAPGPMAAHFGKVLEQYLGSEVPK